MIAELNARRAEYREAYVKAKRSQRHFAYYRSLWLLHGVTRQPMQFWDDELSHWLNECRLRKPRYRAALRAVKEA